MVDSLLDPSKRTYLSTAPGELMSAMVSNGLVESSYSILESICEPGAAVRQHIHDCHEIFYIVEGEITFLLDGNLSVAPQYALVVVRPGVTHAWKNRSQLKARMLVMFIPGEPGGVLSLFNRLDQAEFEEFAAHYGTRFTGPAIDG